MANPPSKLKNREGELARRHEWVREKASLGSTSLKYMPCTTAANFHLRNRVRINLLIEGGLRGGGGGGGGVGVLAFEYMSLCVYVYVYVFFSQKRYSGSFT